MKIEIKLDDPKSCEGCPALWWSAVPRQLLVRAMCKLDYKHGEAIKRGDMPTRSTKCIKENGE